MNNARLVFSGNMRRANELGHLYEHLSSIVPITEQFDDLLRSQLVYAVSAFDRFMHDLIRIGMVQIFQNSRPPTGRYENEGVSLQHLSGLMPGCVPPPIVKFEGIIREKLGHLSFQDPAKVGDGLGLIWAEPQKWQKIAEGFGITQTEAKQRLKLIATRRNAIVHEADLNPITNEKQSITRAEACDSCDFLERLGNKICDLVM